MLNIKKLLLKILKNQSYEEIELPCQYTYRQRTIKCSKQNGTAIIDIDGLETIPVSQDVTIATLPNGWKPKRQYLIDHIGLTGYAFRFTITLSGNIKCYAYGHTDANISPHLVYLVGGVIRQLLNRLHLLGGVYA